MLCINLCCSPQPRRRISSAPSSTRSPKPPPVPPSPPRASPSTPPATSGSPRQTSAFFLDRFEPSGAFKETLAVEGLELPGPGPPRPESLAIDNSTGSFYFTGTTNSKTTNPATWSKSQLHRCLRGTGERWLKPVGRRRQLPRPLPGDVYVSTGQQSRWQLAACQSSPRR